MNLLLEKVQRWLFKLLTILILGTSIILFGKIPDIQAFHESGCHANPILPSTTGQVTITYSQISKTSEQLTFTVRRQTDNFVVISNDISTDDDGHYTRTIGPFSDVGFYNAVFSDFNNLNNQRCATSFQVQTTSGQQACPAFDSYSPLSIFEDTNVSAYFEPVNNSPDPLRTQVSSFGVRIDNGNFIDLERLSLGSTGPGAWSTNLGTLNAGSHGAYLYFYPLNTIPPETPQPCYQMPNITVQQGQNPSNTTSGQNPCKTGVCQTAIGNIPTNPGAFAQKILSIALGLAGGLALILMVIGAIRVLMSEGDQQKLTGGRDMLIAAIAGLLFIILSVIILRFIGLTVLNIPGFG